MAREPGYCLHKPTEQVYVRFDGKAYYLGTHGSDESKERDNRLKAEWLVNRQAAKFQPKANAGPTISDVCNAYLDHAETYYAGSTEFVNLRLACGPLSELFATLPANEFCILQFRACREWWLASNTRSRQYINKQMKRMLRIFKWAVGEGMIPSAIHEAMKCVEFEAWPNKGSRVQKGDSRLGNRGASNFAVLDADRGRHDQTPRVA